MQQSQLRKARQGLLARFAAGEIDKATYDRMLAELDRQVDDGEDAANRSFGDRPTIPPQPSAGPESTSTEDWVGQELSGGRYRVTGKLGEGGMGTVYRAEDTRLGRDVVVKVPHPHLLAVPGFTARFAREIRALTTLEHPHICTVIDADHHAGLPFAVLQYLAGGSLQDRRPRGADGQFAAIRPDELFPWLQRVAETLDFIHQQGHVHRDIKPGNILFDAHRNCCLSDFGIAKALSHAGDALPTTSLTGTGAVPGTPEYIAPEVVMGQPYDGSADQYALGVMLYELLCGRRPFEGATPAAVMVKQVTASPPGLPDQPEHIDRALARAMAKRREERFSSCREFVETLGQAVLKADALPTVADPSARRLKPHAPPADLEQVLAKAKQAYARDDYEAALGLYDKALGVAPKSRQKDIYRRKSACGLHLSRHDRSKLNDALKWDQNALDLDANYLPSHVGIVAAYYCKGHFRNALKQFREIRRRNLSWENHYELLTYVVEILAVLRKLKDAKEYFAMLQKLESWNTPQSRYERYRKERVEKTLKPA